MSTAEDLQMSYQKCGQQIVDGSKREEMGPAYYLNRDMKKVEILITPHSVERFKQRFRKLFVEEIGMKVETVDKNTLIWCFNRANRKTNLGPKLTQRKKSHGQDSIYFVYGPFRFIVQNKVLVTVEIKGQHKDLN